jgi:hypothetical protein
MNNDPLEEKGVLNQRNDKDKEIDTPESGSITPKKEALLNKLTIVFLVLLTLAGLVVTFYIIQ